MVLLDVLGQRWTLRLLWELGQGARCDDVSPTVLNRRLKELKALALVDLGDKGYALTCFGMTLARKLSSLDSWANEWAEMLEGVP
jgi:DNA-binding HxlR family transcriptional regulator